MSDLVFAHNCCLARMLPGEAGMNRSARGGKCVKRFERPNGLDTALYTNTFVIFTRTGKRKEGTLN